MLRDYVRESARIYPGRPALKIRDQMLTYRQLSAKAVSFASMLWAEGVVPGSRVAIWLPKDIATYIAVHGTLAAGCAYVPIDLSVPARRAAWILEDSRAQVLVCRAADLRLLDRPLPSGLQAIVILGPFDNKACDIPDNITRIEWLAIEGYDRSMYSDAHLSRDPEALAYILYTSGSTGTPKGVAISHRASQAFVDWSTSLCALEPSDRISNHASLSFDLAVFDIFATAKAGACLCPVVVLGLASGYVFARLIEEEAITVWYSVPSVLTRIAEQAGERAPRLASLRIVIFAGEPFSKTDLRRFRAVVPGATLYNWYGPTETNVCTSHQVTDSDIQDDAALPIGRPCPYAEMHLTADGEALVSGASLLSGYIRGGEVDPSPLVGVPEHAGSCYRTGDFVSARADGCLLYHGRRDSQLKRHGYRIEAGEIEEVSRAIPSVLDAALLIVEEKMVLFVASCAHKPKDLILAGLAERLPVYMIPDEVVQLSELPRNDRGKLDRVRLQTMTEVDHV